MKWFTCIVHIPGHINPVQNFYTRAETTAEAERYAIEWCREPPFENVDVPLIFEGRIEPLDMPDEPSASEADANRKAKVKP